MAATLLSRSSLEWRPVKARVPEPVKSGLRPVRTRLRTVYQHAICARFHKLYYDSRIWERTRWLGTPVQKLPLDLWLFQELIVELRPDLIIETGTFAGGSALFYASVMDALGSGRVVTVDINTDPARPTHPRIKYITGASTDPQVVDQVRARAEGAERVMVILDSDHTKEHVLGELHAYAPLVTLGSALIVEDTDINGHPVDPHFGPGPMEAVIEFLAGTVDFTLDRDLERRFLVTFHPRGYLRRTSTSSRPERPDR
jgi:cephalosporin hydroxylase